MSATVEFPVLNDFGLKNLDVLEFLRTLPDESVDLVCTDPPYGLSFMGKTWDTPDAAFRRARNDADVGRDSPFGRMSAKAPEYGTGLPKRLRAESGYSRDVEPFVVFSEWVTAWATECLRVLRPGGYLLAMGSCRTYDALAWGIRMAGAEVRDTIHWTYAQGFPKSMDVGKAMDKVAGVERKVVGTYNARGFSEVSPTNDGRNQWAAGEVVDKVGYRTAPATPEAESWDGYGTALKPSHELVCVARKPFQGTLVNNLVEHGAGALDINAGRIPTGAGDRPAGWFKTGTVGSEAAQGCQGESTFRMDERTPAEVAHVADKQQTEGRWPPNTILLHGDGCRLAGRVWVKGDDRTSEAGTGKRSSGFAQPGEDKGNGVPGGRVYGSGEVERWECVEGCPVALLDAQTGTLTSGSGAVKRRSGSDRDGNTSAAYGAESRPAGTPMPMYGDSGGASRFFTLPGEPDEDDLFAYTLRSKYESKVHPRDRVLPGYSMVKPQSGLTADEAQAWLDRFGLPLDPNEGSLDTLTGWPLPDHALTEDDRKVLGGVLVPAKSVHPTMKPVKFLRWLIRLYSPRQKTVGRLVVVVDPFMGSGSTLLAARLEGREAIGNDYTRKYVEIAKARLATFEDMVYSQVLL